MTEHKHIHIVGIGGIGISALARYYSQHLGYTVSGSDTSDSELIRDLIQEGMKIVIGHAPENLPDATTKVIYSEAIITKPDLPMQEQIYSHPELARARARGIPQESYPEALARIFNEKKGIAIAGSHGKSTTTALAAILFTNTPLGANALIGTKIPAFGNTNIHIDDSDIFIIEACEYKRSFLAYRPAITIITNIDLDHLDYYRDIDDYISAFQSLVDQTKEYVIISAEDQNSLALRIPQEKRILVGDACAASIFPYIPQSQKRAVLSQAVVSSSVRTQTLQKEGTRSIAYEAMLRTIPPFELQIPGKHILHDAHLVYALGSLFHLDESFMIKQLAAYTGSWRRMEIIGSTIHGNILMSDYGHHPNEIRPTLQALAQKYPDKKILVVFQPHQYSRTRELLEEFGEAFVDADEVLIPNIYFSRDKKEDVAWMTTDRLVAKISEHHPHVTNGHGFEPSIQSLREYDKNHPESTLILLLGAGDVDTLRFSFDLSKEAGEKKSSIGKI